MSRPLDTRAVSSPTAVSRATPGSPLTVRAQLQQLADAAGGEIPFEEFQATALYSPQSGYYTRHTAGVGTGRDFSTAGSLAEPLGDAIARWLLAHRGSLITAASEPPRRSSWSNVFAPWHVIEIGAGSGQLARRVLRCLGVWGRLRLTYHIVDISPPLIEQQKSLLRGYRVQWHNDVAAALAAANGCALWFANELVDNFPCTVLRAASGASATRAATETFAFHAANDTKDVLPRGDSTNWEELCLRWNPVAERDANEIAGDERGQSGVWCEVWRPLSSRTQERMQRFPFSAGDRAWPPRQRVEVLWSFAEWWQTWRPYWHTGVGLVLDYGEELTTLYHRRPRGTLRGYRQGHRFIEDDVYQHPGMQDITCDVNFTDLTAWSNLLACTTRQQSQREFLAKWCPALWHRIARTPEVAFAATSHGLGDAFQVLEIAPRG